ncbi:hypothetical protein CI102_14666 [Trichoderma harzianum]|jgi:hypothetical protein|nr:hypothetical protein CI102_14666 [Trichoderma harzianum]
MQSYYYCQVRLQVGSNQVDDVLLLLHVYIAKAGAPTIFCLHLRAPELIGPAPAALFNGSEREDVRAIVALALVLLLLPTGLRSLLDANWLLAQAKQYMDALRQSCFISRSDGVQFPSNLQQRASDARHDPRRASHMLSRATHSSCESEY